jgi:formate dehydrogenase alpha subunit
MNHTLTICPYCGTGCSFYLLSDERGRAVGVQPSSTHPVGQGQLCAKGWNAFAFVSHPERLTTPLVRRQGELVPASWEEALSLVAEGLLAIRRQHGPQALMFASSAKATNEENFLLMKLARAVFSTNNIDHCARLCHAASVTGLVDTLGSAAMTNSISCLDEADLFFVIGANPTEQHPIIGARLLQATRRGAGLIVADSRRIRLAHHADLHLRPRQGSDVALLNAMAHVILSEGLEDRTFISTRTENFAALQRNVADWPPERATAVTGLPAEQIAAAARLLAAANKAMILYAMGLTQHLHGADNVRAIANLALLTGNVGRPGAGINPLRGQNNVQGACDMGALPDVFSGYQQVADPAVRQKFARAWGVDALPERPGLTLTAAMNTALAGQLHGMFIMGENPLLSDPDQAHARRALQALQLLVVQDIFLTETAQLADVVLPAASFAERDGTFTSTERRVQRVRRALAAPGACRSDGDILCALAERSGFQGMRYAHPAEVMAEIAALTPIYAGISYARLEGPGLQWPCPTTEHPGTPVLHETAFPRGRGRFCPVQPHTDQEIPDAAFPLLLSTGRNAFQYHTGTMTRRSHLLEREEPTPYVEIHPQDAHSLGIRLRETIAVVTRRGRIEVAARITETVSAGTLFLPFHYAEGAANILTRNALDAESGTPAYKVNAARVEKITGQEGQ